MSNSNYQNTEKSFSVCQNGRDVYIRRNVFFYVSYYENSFNCWQNKIPLSLTKLITIIFCSIRREIGIYFYECNRFRMSIFFNLTFYMQHVEKSVSEHCEIELDLNFNCTFPVDLSSNGILFVSRSVVQVCLQFIFCCLIKQCSGIRFLCVFIMKKTDWNQLKLNRFLNSRFEYHLYN